MFVNKEQNQQALFFTLGILQINAVKMEQKINGKTIVFKLFSWKLPYHL